MFEETSWFLTPLSPPSYRLEFSTHRRIIVVVGANSYSRGDFPTGFLFGSGSSAYQVVVDRVGEPERVENADGYDEGETEKLKRQKPEWYFYMALTIIMAENALLSIYKGYAKDGHKVLQDRGETIHTAAMRLYIVPLMEIVRMKPDLASHISKRCYIPLHNLIQSQADDTDEMWPYEYPVEKARAQFVKTSTDLKPDLVRVVEVDAKTPLHLTVIHNKTEIVEILLTACLSSLTDVTVSVKTEETPTTSSSTAPKAKDAKMDVNVRNIHGKTPLDIEEHILLPGVDLNTLAGRLQLACIISEILCAL
ncbi:hypothetical protein FNV43_RR01819 [Rhamnella rubrinervis]|uniref:Uncharacterized protein n=1 Tax=Rhamnella rubrinervis TaxID=2594499 RepID=A0A8K0MSN2_9ROSA|nr:hypothetical protein FNV43_RR01819 [Rhamnella rubrinervis]